MPMRRIYEYLMCVLMGPYVVREELRYGQYAQLAPRARFFRLARAKAFAKSLIPEFGGRVYVMDGMKLQPLYVYKQR